MSKARPFPLFSRRRFLGATAAAALYPHGAQATTLHAEDIRRKVGAPAAGVAFRRDGQITLSVTGRRADGFDTQVAEDDLWHLGSLTKSMTAVLAARLVEQGAISFDDTIGKRLGRATKSLQAVTLEQLLQHRGGLAANIPNGVAISLQALEGTASASEIRRQYAYFALVEPVLPAGAFLYSNAGYVTAAAMMEAATGRSWEDLIAEEGFRPPRPHLPRVRPAGRGDRCAGPALGARERRNGHARICADQSPPTTSWR